jgi:ATP synthase protein I
MTTAPPLAQPGYRTTSLLSVIALAMKASLAAGAVLLALAAAVAGGDAVIGVVIGTAMVCLFFGLGALVLAVVTRLAPAASLMVALLTYTLKVLLVGLVFAALSTSGALDGPVDPRWLAGAVIACTFAWLGAQVVGSVRARELAYDLPASPQAASVR